MDMNTPTRLYSLPFSDVKAYLLAALFVAGNIALPQLCHLIPNGGPTWLPIYFFTLVAAYKFGLRVGLMTAVLSPVLRCSPPCSTTCCSRCPRWPSSPPSS